MSFTSAALSTMRANAPAHPSSAAPRHTYSSSYARDYADIQAYQDYLKTIADKNTTEKAKQKDAYLHQNSSYQNRSNPVSPQAESRESARAQVERVKAPYAQDGEYDGGLNRDYRGKSTVEYDANKSEPYRNPNRYVSTAKESYVQPDQSRIAAQLPPPPSRQAHIPPQSARGKVEAPYALHDEAPKQQQQQRPSTAAVPALSLNRIPKGAFEPYASDAAPEPTITRVAKEEQDRRDAAEEERYEDEMRWRRANLYNAQSAAYDEDREAYYARREQEDRDQSAYESAHRHEPNRSELDEFAKSANPYSQDYPEQYSRREHQHMQQQRHQEQEDDWQEDEVSRPVERLDLNRARSRGRANDDADEESYEENNYRAGRTQQHRGGYDRSVDSARERAAEDARDPYSNDYDRRPYESYLKRDTPAYLDKPAGRSSGLEPHLQRNRGHQPIFGAPPAPAGRPAKKMVPTYDEYIEKSNRESGRKRVGKPIADPEAAGQRVGSSGRYGHLESGFHISGEAESRRNSRQQFPSDYETSTRRGAIHSVNESIYTRNPILQDSERYDPRPGSFKQQHERHTRGSEHHGSNESMASEHLSSDVVHRARVDGRHPSVESSHLHQLPYGAKNDLMGYKHDLADRGVRIVPNASHAHSNIFGAASSTDASAEYRFRGVKVAMDRNASHADIVGSDLLYDKRPAHDWLHGSDNDRDYASGAARSDADAAPLHGTQLGYLQSSVSSGVNKSNVPFSPREKSLAYVGSNRLHLSSDQQAERDAYEQQLRALHQERLAVSARGAPPSARAGQGYESTRLW